MTYAHADASNEFYRLKRLVRANPLSLTARANYADLLDRHQGQAQAAVLRAGDIPLDWFDALAVAQLAGCKVGVAGQVKTLARLLMDRCNDLGADSCAPRPYCWLWIYLHRYRRSVREASVRQEAEARYPIYCRLMGVKATAGPRKKRRRRRRRRQQAA